MKRTSRHRKKHSSRFDIIQYPQNIASVIEIIFSLCFIIYFIRDKSYSMIYDFIFQGFLVVSLTKSWLVGNINYGTVREQFNGPKKKGDLIRRSYPRILVYCFFMLLLLSCCCILNIRDNNIKLIGGIACFVILIFELIIIFITISPFLFFILICVFITLITNIGIDKAFFNWAFLGLIFVTTIGSNFFDKSLVEDKFPNRIAEKNLILRKISYYIGIVFLYFSIVLSEVIRNSTYYYVYITSQNNQFFNFLLDLIVKGSSMYLLLDLYFTSKEKISYLIFCFYYRNKEFKYPDALFEVSLDAKKTWKVGEQAIEHKELSGLERIGINTYQKKGEKNIFYVDSTSEIHEIIGGLKKPFGESILGVVNKWKIIIELLLIFAVLPLSSIVDQKFVRINDGIYTIEEKPDKAEVPNKIEVLGDAIVYNGKVEAFDTHTQSFEHGTISIRKKDKHSIELTKNVGDKTKVVYQKMDANGIPIKLQEKYTGHSKKPGNDGLIFSEGNSTLIFDKNDNIITNKTENHTETFVVIPEDKLDGEAKVAFNKHKSEYKGAHFIFTVNKKYDKDSSNVYVAVLSDGGKTIQINELEYSGKDNEYLYRFTGKAE